MNIHRKIIVAASCPLKPKAMKNGSAADNCERKSHAEEPQIFACRCGGAMCCRFKQRQRFGHAQRAAVRRLPIECGERAVGMWAVSVLVAAKLLRLLRSATILGTTTRLGPRRGFGGHAGERAATRGPVVALVGRSFRSSGTKGPLQSSPHSLWEPSAPPHGASFFRAGTRPLAVALEHRNASTPPARNYSPRDATRVKRTSVHMGALCPHINTQSARR